MPSLKLRQDTVRTLAYIGRGGKHQCIYWDSDFECFGVRVYPSGRRTYVYSYRANRRKRMGKLGRVDTLTLDQARKSAKIKLGKVADHQDPQDEVDELRAACTVKELAAAYIEQHAKPKKKEWKADESCLRRLLLPKFGARLARTLTSADMQAIHTEKGLKHPTAANKFLDVVRKMYNWAKKPAKLIADDFENPATDIQRFPERKRKRFITTVEMPRFIEALEQEPSDYPRHGIWLLLFTGLRMRELLKAKWQDIDWDMGTLFIGLTKNGEPLLAPLSDAALARLKLVPRIANNPYIICGKLSGDHFKDLREPLARVLKQAGLANIHIHDLRRTVGSWLAHSGTSLHLIGDVLNHLDPATTAGYAFFQTQHRRDALSSHADKVLTFAAPHLRVPTEPRTLGPEDFPHLRHASRDAVPPRLHHRHHFKREALYELVWTAPVRQIAMRLGVSDVGLAKLCRRSRVPIPGRGHWARIEAGQSLPRRPLPPAPDGLPPLLRIRGTKPPPQTPHPRSTESSPLTSSTSPSSAF